MATSIIWTQTEAEARVAAGLPAEPTQEEREYSALAMKRMARIVARFDGRCKDCGGHIERGEEIAYGSLSYLGTRHIACVVREFTPVPHGQE